MPVKKGYKGDYKKVMKEFTVEVKRRDVFSKTYEPPHKEDFRYQLFYNANWIYDHTPRFPFEMEGGEFIAYRRIIEKPDSVRIGMFNDMNKYDAFDAFLTEHIKNSICEDNLGDIISFL